MTLYKHPTSPPLQEISGCDRTTHWDLLQNQGRGATEIDVMEAMPGKQVSKGDKGDLGVGLPYMSSTLQISPGVPKNRPVPGKNFTELGVRFVSLPPLPPSPPSSFWGQCPRAKVNELFKR